MQKWSCRERKGHDSRVAAVCAILLLLVGPGCSRQSPPEPVTLTFLDVEWDAPDRLPALAKDLDDFTRESGIRVRRLPAPEGSLNQLALWRESLQKGAAAPDVYSIDVIWSGILNPYLMDLKSELADELSSQDPMVMASFTVGDKVVAVPHHVYVGVLLYRNDLLRKYGAVEPPTTWDELETMAARIQAGERANGEKGLWGLVWQGSGESLTCSGLEWQSADGAGRIIENDATISVNNPQTIHAWERAARWVGSISPPGVTAYAKWDADNIWLSGKAVFARGWESDYSLIEVHRPPGGTTKFGVTSVPGGAKGRAGTLGGNGLAVSRATAHPREALGLVRFLRQRDLRNMQAHAHSDLPKELELYALPTVLKLYPRHPEVRRHGGGVVARPSIVAGQKYEEVTRAYMGAVHSVLTGEKTAAVAAAALEHELRAITGFRVGPPSNRD